MNTGTIVAISVIALAGVAVVYLWTRSDRDGAPQRPRTFGERLGVATGDVSDAVGSLSALFGGR